MSWYLYSELLVVVVVLCYRWDLSVYLGIILGRIKYSCFSCDLFIINYSTFYVIHIVKHTNLSCSVFS